MYIQFLINCCIKNTNINNNIENKKYSKYIEYIRVVKK